MKLSGIQRKRLHLEGVAVSPDRVVGMASMYKESLVLSSTSRVIKPGRFRVAESSDEKTASFFEEIRVETGATCDTVRTMLASGAFLEESPF